ncbi:MAG: glycosyltransferase family 39 protein [Gemmatimonadaceae bacterium]|nr:glycosyltransferase family 39 protein [Gemmatimonadaceae bacterium]
MTTGLPHSEPTAQAVWRRTVGWILGAALLRGLLSALVPLLPDETYYWDWSRRLEAGYFDHPPGIALLIALGTKVLGPTAAGVRLGPALAALITHVAAAAAAWLLGGRELTGARAALRAAQLIALMPIATAGLVLATPDAALFAAATVAVLAVERALAQPPRSLRSLAWWTLAGVALGGAFVAKYTAVLLPFGLVLACLFHPALRKRFLDLGPWWASLIALGLFAPVVVWNAFNDWVSFRFQLGHGFNAAARGNPLSRELEMLGGQAGLASPILFGLLALVLWQALRDGWRDRHTLAPTDIATRRFALAVVSLTPLAFFAVSAWRRPVEANWPAMIYPAGILLLATSRDARVLGVWWKRGLVFAGVLVSVVALQVATPVMPVPPRRDPIARAFGWDSLAAAVDRVRHDPWLDGTVDRWVAANTYQDASELAFHLPDHPRVFSLNLATRTNQYDVWPNAWGRVRPGDALVLAIEATPKGDSLAAVVGQWFDETKPGGSVSLRRKDGEVTARRLWLYRIARTFPREKP